MKNNKILENLSPDLYLRYLYGFEIIKKIQKNKPCRIIDVGGRAGIMGDFIKKEKLPYNLTIIDVLPDIKNKNTICDKYIQQDFLTFSTETKFDYLVTFDVLEHVNDKNIFINKCLSLCNSLILSAPFKSDIVDKAEHIVDEYFFKYKGIHHPWLKEHFEQGLPEINWLKDFLNSKKIKFKILDSNNIENWVDFMLPNQIPELFPIDTKKLKQINQYYNQNYQYLGDATSPSYRKIVVTLSNNKTVIPREFILQKTETNTQKKIILTNMIIDFLTKNIDDRNKNISLKIDDITQEKEKTKQLQLDLDKIQSSKTYKLWQKYNKIKKIILRRKN